MPFVKIGPRRAIDAETIVGNVYLGDVTIQQFADRPASEPNLPWLTDLDTDTRDFDLLRWHARLTPLLGRDEEMEGTLAWAIGAGTVKARFVTGAGGIGKSRFAAEVAERLREQGWTAGFIDLRKEAVVPVSQAGLLLIIDYPEENRSEVRRFLEDLGRLRLGVGGKIRVLLLSRRGEEVWGDDVVQADASHLFSRIEVPPLRQVQSVTEAFPLFCGTVERLSNLRGVKVASIEPTAFEKWFSGSDLHRLPLFLTAAAVQTVNAPGEAALSLSGREVIGALVKRERRRAAKEGAQAGLPEHTLPRLYALAAIRDGLDTATLHRFADPALRLAVGKTEDMIDRLRSTGRLSNGTLLKPQPDIVAAAFLVQELARSPQDAPEWLSAAMTGQEADAMDRAARLAHDAEVVLGIHEHRLTAWLTMMLDGRPERCVPLNEWMSEGTRGLTMPVIASVVAMTLNSIAVDDAERARCLTSGSNYLSAAGDGTGALVAIKEAVAIRRKLTEAAPACFLPDLATSLNNLSNRLSEAGDGAGALTAVEEAVAIRRKLADSTPERFLPDLASSLNNLSNRLSATGDGAGALTAIEEALELYRTLAEVNPARFLPDLASSLNNLSNHLSSDGDGAGALTAIEDAVGLYRTLAEAAPARFLPDLAMGLNNLSNRLSEVGDGAGALTAIEEAVSIRRKLAEAAPARFLPDLASSLNNLSNHLSSDGDGAGAMTSIQEAVDIYRTLAEAAPARFLPDLAMSLNNLSSELSAAGDQTGALTAIEEAVDLYRNLAAAAPARFLPDLAMGLNNLSSELSATSDQTGALKAIEEAVGIYRTLASAAPVRFLPDLATSLNNLSNHLSAADDGVGALTAIQEAVTIRRKLAESKPRQYAHLLANSLKIMASLIAGSGTLKDAISILDEAIHLIEPVAKANSKAFPARWHRQMLIDLEKLQRNAGIGSA
ncbi:tetratricopeptide repeat protein [Azospirillum argentinense]|uniref:Tetratricopeptide repeat protein n=1 Tax=Azospirillum argentinense TaxID=2970906 RepID=A0A4D8P6U1_9PROT|nr:tetratricopeptide repeat protein [Azospirillum argentinense]QCN94406.1 tetratricopeptide repeat protein [Azospirillum argentinense]